MSEAQRPNGRSFMPRSIRSLALVFAGMSALVTVVLGLVTFVVVHQELERQIDHRIDIEAEALLDYGKAHGFEALVGVVALRDRRSSPDGIGYLAGVDDRLGRDMGYRLTDAAGRVRAGTLKADMPPVGWSEFLKFRRADGSTGEAQVLNSVLPGGGNLVVAGDRARVHAMDSLLLKLFGAAFGTLLLLGGIMVLLFGWIISRRLKAIELTARSIIAGDIAQRMPMDGSGVELDRLSMLLNQMLERICILVDNLRAVSSGIAHDLRTPLSRLRVKLERAAEGSSDPKQRDLLDDALAESDRLLDLFGGLLAIAEIDGQSVRARFASVDLKEAVTEIAEAYRPSFEDAGKVFELSAERVAVFGDRALLQRLVGNLLDNILKHAPSSKVVRIDLAVRDDKAVLRVGDDGPGIPAADRERVFEQLVRLNANRSGPGYGLGLSLVAVIARAHGGIAEIVPCDDGTMVGLELPALPA